jgi:transposase
LTLDVRELIRRLRAGQSNRIVARELGMARLTVARYRAVAEAEGWLSGELPELGELQRLLGARHPAPFVPRHPFRARVHHDRIIELRDSAVPIKVIWERLRDEHGYTGSPASVWRYVRTLETSTAEAFVRIEVAPGAEAQVDFGYAGRLVDPRTGELRRAWAFIMTLSHSRHQYATFVFDQKVSTWLACHRQAFEYFGGVPRKIVLDNLKAAIVKAALHDPVVQRSYREFAEHYGFLISPCRPRTPRHKGKVESGVKYLVRSFLAGRPPELITDANRRVLRWIEETAGMRVHGTTRKQPLPCFLEVEKSALLPLPASAYDGGIWKQAKLHPDCHAVCDGAFYSAPHRLIGKLLWVRSNGIDVQIFHDWERVASHRWGPPGTRRTQPIHYPPDKVAFLMATPQYCRSRAEQIGPFTAEVIGALLAERPLDRLRTAQATLRLADKYGARRLESACRRGLAFGDVAYGVLKRVLERGLEAEALPEAEPLTLFNRSYKFARPGPEIFGGLDHGA